MMQEPPRSQFRIGTMMAGIAIIALVLAFIAQAGAFAIVLVIPVAVGLVVALSESKGRDGHPAALVDFVKTFLIAFGTMSTILIAPVLACFAIIAAVATIPANVTSDGAWGVIALVIGIVGVVLSPFAVWHNISRRRGKRKRGDSLRDEDL